VRQLAYSASPETTVASSSGALRCPYSGCPYNSVSFVGWEKAAWMSHINSIHIVGERRPLPATCSPSVLTCEGCGLIISSRGCQTCKGKPGIAVSARMDSPVLSCLRVYRENQSQAKGEWWCYKPLLELLFLQTQFGWLLWKCGAAAVPRPLFSRLHILP